MRGQTQLEPPALTFPRLLDEFPGAALAVSTRLLRSAYTGACLRLRRSSDAAEKNFGFDVFTAGVHPVSLHAVSRRDQGTGGTMISIGQASAGKRPTLFGASVGRCEYNGANADSPSTWRIGSWSVVSGKLDDVTNEVLRNADTGSVAATALDIGATEANIGSRVGGASPYGGPIVEAICYDTDQPTKWRYVHAEIRRYYRLM
jgi:hypothetical protein